MDVTLVLLGLAVILFLGFFAEFIFKRLGIPDVLMLIILGFVIGPNVLGYASPAQIADIAPVFTTFTLIFLLFYGAFNIHLSSLVKEFSHSFLLTIFNFVISSIIITIIMMFARFNFLTSLLVGFILGGVSSSFVIPILKQLNVSEKIYSILTLESALTDVFCIVFSLTVLELINFGSFGFKETFSQLASLFAVGGLIGAVAGVIWIFLVVKVFNEPHYMVTIAYLIFIYVLTEFLSGNGAIAALFFGLVLKNSKKLVILLKGIKNEKRKSKSDLEVSVIKPSETFFYGQISFLLKTFFFVYIGMLIDITNYKTLIFGGIISIVLLFARMSSSLITRKMSIKQEFSPLVNSFFARGLAAAAIVQLVIQSGLEGAEFIAAVTYVVITGTIVLSSISIFFAKRGLPKPKVAKK